MSTTNISDRPAFQSLDIGTEADRPPVSRLALVAFVAGLASLLAALSIVLLPLSMLAIAVGGAVVWKLSRDEQVGGLWLAQAGLAMATASVAWSVTARAGMEEYLYAEAGKYAKVFLDTLASGNKYEALELRQPESMRQLTGTDLEKYYSQLDEEQREGNRDFLESELTNKIVASGPQADWQFSRGIDVTHQSNQTYVTVEMVNRAKQPAIDLVQVRMRRQTGVLSDPDRKDTTALWNFEELLLP